MNLRPGMTATLSHVVEERDLATRWKNDVEVMSTPILLWLAELACMEAVKREIVKPAMTVGAAHAIKHAAPTPRGFLVEITATLAEIDGKRLVFDVTAHDGADTILTGTHERFIVDQGKFQARVDDKAKKGRAG